MMQKLLQNIAFMAVLIALGTLDLFTALFASKWWLSLIGMLVALFAYYVAWLDYRIARKIAKEIDEVFKIILTDMSILTQALKSILSKNEATDDHEDIGHPV